MFTKELLLLPFGELPSPSGREAISPTLRKNKWGTIDSDGIDVRVYDYLI